MQPMNILFITTHDLGRFLNCYGRSTINSPNLDELARIGVRFANSFCTAPQCSPSRAALHTGRYPHSNGMLGLAHPPFGWELADGEKHFARRMQENGYRSVLVGEQHVSSSDRNVGYDQILPRGNAQKMGEDAAHKLQELKQQNQPFYLEVGFHEPHRPYEWGGAVADASKGVEVPGFLPDCLESRLDFAALQGSIQAMDAGVGLVLDGLRQAGLEQDTWVIFTTDHGVAMPRAKGTLYDPGIETALIMSWPGKNISGGVTYSEMISNVDIVPTMLEGLGLAIPPEIQGKSFWSLLQGQPYISRDEIFAEKTYHQHYEPMRAIRTHTHKLVANMEASTTVDVPSDARQSPIYPLLIPQFSGNRDEIELYDLDNDPLEQRNIAGQADVADIERDLGQRLYQWMSSTNDPILKGPVPSPYYYDVLDWLKKQ